MHEVSKPSRHEPPLAGSLDEWPIDPSVANRDRFSLSNSYRKGRRGSLYIPIGKDIFVQATTPIIIYITNSDSKQNKHSYPYGFVCVFMHQLLQNKKK